ncbi:DNA-processing protein DprA [Propionicimonas sp.]|uniref:DNA-processing protein DprA n=1 Tax=Propionicimonas sp. TaxID=1955623 RepID=UPI0039E45FC8
MDERTARMCLAAVVEPGHPATADAVADYGAEQVWAALLSSDQEGPLAARARRIRPGELVERTRTHGLRFVVPGDPEWPPRLADLASCEPVNQLSGPPLGLWLAGRGDLSGLVATSVSIVGSRASTAYGDLVAADLGAELSEAGRSVVSGGAYGIDAAAHRGCLAGRSATVCVQAGGLDAPYPGGHRPLFERITQSGVLVSELAPGVRPSRVRFPICQSILCLSPQRSGGTAGQSPRGTGPVELGSRSPQQSEGQAASGSRVESPLVTSELHSVSPPRGRERHRHNTPGHGQPYGLAHGP